MPGTRKLGRTTDHRKAMLRGMVTYLLENGKVETTVTRAKEVRSMAEKMITIAKDNTLTAKRQVYAYVTKDEVVKKLFDQIAPKYADVKGGYTRIIKPAPAAATLPKCASSNWWSRRKLNKLLSKKSPRAKNPSYGDFFAHCGGEKRVRRGT